MAMKRRTRALNHLRAADPQLAQLIDAVGPCKLAVEEAHSLYEALARAVIYQQLTGKAAATIAGRVAALGGGGFPTPAEVVALADEALRGAGLSRAKTAALKDLAQKTIEGVVPAMPALTALTDDEIVERLTIVRGIGRWTVEMLLIFRLGREDVLPVTDYGVRKGFQRAFRKRTLPNAKDIEKRARAWRPYRSVASWYLWRAAEMKP